MLLVSKNLYANRDYYNSDYDSKLTPSFIRSRKEKT